MLLQVVPFARDVRRDFELVRETDTRNLAQGRVGLLGRRRLDARAHTTLERVALQRGRFRLLHHVLSGATDQLIDGWHSPFECSGTDFYVNRAGDVTRCVRNANDAETPKRPSPCESCAHDSTGTASRGTEQNRKVAGSGPSGQPSRHILLTRGNPTHYYCKSLGINNLPKLASGRGFAGTERGRRAQHLGPEVGPTSNIATGKTVVWSGASPP